MSEILASTDNYIVTAHQGVVLVSSNDGYTACAMPSDTWHELCVKYTEYMGGKLE